MVEGGMSCVKYILGVFNFVFVIFGIVLIVLGVQSLTTAASYSKIIEDTPDASSVLCIIIGVFLFIIAFLGCCGAFRENNCMLITFSVVVVIILVIEFIIGGLVIGFKNEAKSAVTKGLRKYMEKYQDGSNDTATIFFDELQEKQHCCGVYNYTDWKESKTGNIPKSCCINNSTLTMCMDDYSNVWPKGCANAIFELLKSAYGPLGGVAIAIALVQLLGVIFACCLAYAIKKEYQVV